MGWISYACKALFRLALWKKVLSLCGAQTRVTGAQTGWEAARALDYVTRIRRLVYRESSQRPLASSRLFKSAVHMHSASHPRRYIYFVLQQHSDGSSTSR